MNIYHAWCNLKDGVKDTDFSDRAEAYFGHLKDQGLIAGYRITRQQLGLGPKDLPEFHLMVELEDLAQVDRVFGHVATRGAGRELPSRAQLAGPRYHLRALPGLPGPGAPARPGEILTC